MRIPPLAPEALSPELRHVHDGIVALVANKQQRITVVNEQQALIGPFPAMLRFPQFGVPALTFQRALATQARLAKTVREVAILAVGAAFGARYEIYAHELTAAEVGLSPAQVSALAAGAQPPDLSEQEAIAHDFARALVAGRILPASTYARAVELLGLDGVGELAFLISGYCQIAVLLNAFDVPAPD